MLTLLPTIYSKDGVEYFDIIYSNGKREPVRFVRKSLK